MSSVTGPTAPVAPTTPIATSRPTLGFCLRSGEFVPDEVVIASPFAAETPASLLEHDFGAERTRVVRRGHDAAVGPGELDRYQVSALRQRQLSIHGEEVAALAERPREVDGRLLAIAVGEHGDRVLRAVEGGPEEIVRASVADDDRPASCLFHVQDPGHERAGRADEVTSWLQQERRAKASRQLGEPRRVLADEGLRGSLVGDADAAADVEVSELNPRLGELAPKVRGTTCGREHGLDVEQLRADVEREPDRLERGIGLGALKSFDGIRGVDPELARGDTGGEVLVAAPGNVGIQSYGHLRHPTERSGGRRDFLQLLERLDVQRADAGLDRRANLVLALANAGEDDSIGGDPSPKALRQLAAGDDVGAELLLCDDAEDGKRVVGLDRVAGQVRDAGERRFERSDPFTEAVEVVRVERRPDLGGDGRKLAQTCSRSLPADASSKASWRASTVRSASSRSTKNEILIGDVTMKRASTPISRSVAKVRAAMPGWLFMPAPIRLTFASPST